MNPALKSKFAARLPACLLLTAVLAPLLYALLGQRVASALAARFGAQLLAKGDGKFTDASIFIHGRLREIALLISVACVLLLIYQMFSLRIARRRPVPARWVIQGWAGFFFLNVFIAVAAHTVLFWCLLFSGKDHTHNYTQWRIKAGLLTEVAAPRQAVLLGTSQSRSEIDSKILNERLGDKVWTTELHFPGSSIFDRSLCLKRLPAGRIDYVITYFCEFDLFGAHDNERMIYFFGFRDLPDCWALGPGRPTMDPWMAAGLLGDVFPLYRIWDSLIARARFWQQGGEPAQAQYDATLETDLAERARRKAGEVYKGEIFECNQRAFEAFAKLCRERHCQLVICCGQVNPLLGDAMDPTVRPAMLDYLHRQAAQDPNIILIEEPLLPHHVAADYEDLTHVTLATRARSSIVIADVLEKLDRKKSP
jgi:hypothetical protein